jgi:predicted esterase
MTKPIESPLQEELSLSAGINLYYDLQPAPSSPSPLLIALHGYGANKRQMMREAQQMAPEGFAIVSLQGFHQHIRESKEKGGPLRFGFGWLTNYRPEESVEIHHQALNDLISTLTRQRLADPARLFLLGFSQSCALNYRFAFTHPELLRGVVGICGGVPGDWETSKLYKKTSAAIFHLAGTHDDFYPPERVVNYGSQLRTRSESVTFRSYDAGHEIVPEMRTEIRNWLQNGS